MTRRRRRRSTIGDAGPLGLPWWAWLAGGVGVLALVGGGIAVVKVVVNAAARKRLAALMPYIDAASKKWGIPRSWLAAFSHQESAHDPNARATDPRDLARGGSFGATQMSYQTAVGLGYKGEPSGLLNPAVGFDLTAKLLATTRTNNPGSSLADLAAAYNSGRTLSKLQAAIAQYEQKGDTKRAAGLKHARDVYVPRIVAFQREYADLDRSA